MGLAASRDQTSSLIASYELRLAWWSWLPSKSVDTRNLELQFVSSNRQATFTILNGSVQLSLQLAASQSYFAKKCCKKNGFTESSA